MKNLDSLESRLFYDRTAQDYEMRRFSGKSGNWNHKRQSEIILKLCGKLNGLKVLEVGCGTGRITHLLLSHGAHIVGIDDSTKMLEIAESRNYSRISQIQPIFRQASVYNIPKDLGQFDAVVMVNVFGRLHDPNNALKQIRKVLSPSGFLLFNFPCLFSFFMPFGAIVNIQKKSIGRPVISRWYWAKQVLKLLSQESFKVVSRAGHYYVPMPNYFYVFLPAIMLLDSILSAIKILCHPSVFLRCEIIK